MNVAIWDINQSSQVVSKIIERFYNSFMKQNGREEFNVAAHIAMHRGGAKPLSLINNTAIIDLAQFKALYDKKVISGLILPRENFSGSTTVLPHLMRLNINLKDIYITRRLTSGEFAIEPYFSAKYLPYLEFHIADQCNLNCKACEHYSGLVKEPKFPDFDKFSKDMEQLHNFIDDIGVIRIMGGEPLLNSQINDYIELSRKLYPASTIYVVTNALLLKDMPEDFFETLKSQNAGIFISFYPPMVSKMDSIRDMLNRKGINHFITNLNEKFSIKQTLVKHNKPKETFLNCFQANCNNLYEGKMAACFLPFTTKYFNKYFNKNLPEDGAIDLYDENLTTEILKYKLKQPFERCCYCTSPVDIDWQSVKYPSSITDWVNEY